MRDLGRLLATWVGQGVVGGIAFWAIQQTAQTPLRDAALVLIWPLVIILGTIVALRWIERPARPNDPMAGYLGDPADWLREQHDKVDAENARWEREQARRREGSGSPGRDEDREDRLHRQLQEVVAEAAVAQAKLTEAERSRDAYQRQVGELRQAAAAAEARLAEAGRERDALAKRVAFLEKGFGVIPGDPIPGFPVPGHSLAGVLRDSVRCECGWMGSGPDWERHRVAPESETLGA